MAAHLHVSQGSLSPCHPCSHASPSLPWPQIEGSQAHWEGARPPLASASSSGAAGSLPWSGCPWPRTERGAGAKPSPWLSAVCPVYMQLEHEASEVGEGSPTTPGPGSPTAKFVLGLSTPHALVDEDRAVVWMGDPLPEHLGAKMAPRCQPELKTVGRPAEPPSRPSAWEGGRGRLERTSLASPSRHQSSPRCHADPWTEGRAPQATP